MRGKNKNKLKFRARRPLNMAENFHYKLGPKRDDDTQLELLMRRRIDEATKKAFPNEQERQEYIQALIKGLV